MQTCFTLDNVNGLCNGPFSQIPGRKAMAGSVGVGGVVGWRWVRAVGVGVGVGPEGQYCILVKKFLESQTPWFESQPHQMLVV